MVETLAIFDLDSTLYEGDCELTWCELLYKHGIVNTAFMVKLKVYCVEYEVGGIDYEEYERFILSPVAQKSPAQVQQLMGEYLQEIHKGIRPAMQAVVDDHRAKGHNVLLATASNSFVAAPIAALLGIQNVVCTNCELVEGVPTGNLLGKTAFREGKVGGVKAWVEEHNASLADSWGYSDSHNDIPILTLVEHPVAVTPDAKLRRLAQQNGWQILDANAQAL